jgi:predicted site-specific integrase-resolvase
MKLSDYKGYQIVGIIKEVVVVLTTTANDYDLIAVEHKDRLTRVSFNYIQVLLKNLDKEVCSHTCQ